MDETEFQIEKIGFPVQVLVLVAPITNGVTFFAMQRTELPLLRDVPPAETEAVVVDKVSLMLIVPDGVDDQYHPTSPGDPHQNPPQGP